MEIPKFSLNSERSIWQYKYTSNIYFSRDWEAMFFSILLGDHLYIPQQFSRDLEDPQFIYSKLVSHIFNLQHFDGTPITNYCIYTFPYGVLTCIRLVLDKPFWLFSLLASCDFLFYRTMGKKAVEEERKVRVYGKTKPKTTPKSKTKKPEKTVKEVKKHTQKVKNQPEKAKKKDTKKEKKGTEKSKVKESSGTKSAKRQKVTFDPTPVVVPPRPSKGAQAEKKEQNEKRSKKEEKTERPSALKSPLATPLKGNLAMVEAESPACESASPSALGKDLEELERDKKAARKQGVSLEQFLANKSEQAVEEHMKQLMKENELADHESSEETEAEDGEEEESEEDNESEDDPMEDEADQKEKEEEEDAETDSSSDSVEDSSDSSSEAEEEEEEKTKEKPKKAEKTTRQSSEVAKAEACAEAVEKQAVKQKANSIWS